MNLNHIIGLPLHNNTEVVDSFEEETSITLLPESMDASDAPDVTSRPEFHLLTKQVEMKEREVDLARSDFVPIVAIMGAYGYTHGLKINARSLIDDRSLAALRPVQIPRFDSD